MLRSKREKDQIQKKSKPSHGSRLVHMFPISLAQIIHQSSLWKLDRSNYQHSMTKKKLINKVFMVSLP